MKPERWQQIERLYHSALEREAGQRVAFLAEACAGDDALRREVESLLANDTQVESFIEPPAMEVEAKVLAADQPGVIGQSLGHYQILSLLGVGGMGQVYRARDTKLDRTVALKLPPAEVASDAERMRRFVREAKAASALNHPNVAHIYEIGEAGGVSYMAMEYVEGQTLAAKINGQPLEVGEVAEIGSQIADALDEAHRKGITHRDIKPQNIMLTPRGQVKVLDFGLAKITRPAAQAVGSDITTLVNTVPGVIMGTVPYMSPEQALGREVDHRSDIFNLGVLLYETATGRLPFDGANSGGTLDRILHAQPEAMARFNHGVPEELERIVRKCLEKNRERRYQSARELIVDLGYLQRALNEADEGQSYIETRPRRGYKVSAQAQAIRKPLEGGVAANEPERRRKSWLRRGAVALGSISLVIAVLGWYVFRSRPVPPGPHSQVVPLTSYPGAELSPSFSPDASQVAFSWNGMEQDNFDIYVKLVDRGDPLRLTSNAAPDTSPAWSPDGRQIAFIRQGSVFLISPLGGRERRLADVQAGHLDWTPDSKSLAVSSELEGSYRLLRVSADTGETSPLVAPAGKGYSFGDISFAVSPDGLKLAWARFLTCCTADLFLAPMAGGEGQRLTENGAAVWGMAWTPDGRELIYAVGQLNTSATLWRRQMEMPSSVTAKRIEGVEEGSLEPVIARHSPADNMRMAYERIALDTNIWVKDTERSSLGPRRIIASTRRDADPQFSPNGQRMVFASDRSGIRQIWVCDRDGSNPVQLTSFTSGLTNAPRWSPDGRHLAFSAIIDNNRDIYVISPEGGVPRRLTVEPSEDGRPSWSRDGRWVYFYSSRTGLPEIWKMPAEGGAAVRVTAGGGQEGLESPDGRLLYYQYLSTGLRSVSTTETSPREGAVFLPAVRISWWAVADEGIYFVEFDEKGASPYRVGGPFVFSGWAAGLSKVSQTIRFYNFATNKVTQIGQIEREVERTAPGFSVTRDGRLIAWSQIDHTEADLMMIENFR